MKKEPTGRNKLIIFTTILVAISIIVAVVSTSINVLNPVTGVAGAVLVPLQNAVSKVGDGISGFFEYFYKYDAVLAENEILKEELAEYEKLEREYHAAIDENTSLRSLARITAENPTYEYALADVTAISTGGYSKVVTLNLGQKDDIELYDCVITAQGLVGYVTEVGANFSEVTCVTDPTMKIGAIISQTREVVVAEGSAELLPDGLLKLSYVANNTHSNKGDFVETSGYGGIFPEGIAIGYIEEVTMESHGISSYATVTPSVEIDKLKKVFVIKSIGEETVN